MARVSFVIPGDIDLPTGGYAYDRRVLRLLRQRGGDLAHVVLPGSFPFPLPADLALTEERLAATPADGVLLIDGLALGAIPADLMRRVNRRFVALIHHPLHLESGLSETQAKALFESERDVLALAAHTVVTSPTTKTLVARNFNVAPDRITIAEPGTARTLRARGSATGAPARLLAVGSIVPRKGHHVLIEALTTMTDLDWSLDIAGAVDRSPETAERVRALVETHRLDTRIRMLGAVDDSRLSDLYADADIFVMPSLFEGYGMVLAEAMVRGLPIVCTTGGAAAETAPDAAAIKVPPGDSQGLARSMRRLIEDPQLRRQMADAAWAAGQKLPRWEDTARIIAEVLESHAA